MKKQTTRKKNTISHTHFFKSFFNLNANDILSVTVKLHSIIDFNGEAKQTANAGSLSLYLFIWPHHYCGREKPNAKKKRKHNNIMEVKILKLFVF